LEGWNSDLAARYGVEYLPYRVRLIVHQSILPMVIFAPLFGYFVEPTIKAMCPNIQTFYWLSSAQATAKPRP
jgi:hypothetical protein